MASDTKIEIIQKAIRKLIEDDDEVNAKTVSSREGFPALIEDEDNGKPGDRRLLSKLLSELDSLEEINNESKQEEGNIEGDTSSSQVGNEEIIKELKNVKRQNLITHCLLTAMIVVTLAWQVSEVSIILKIKDGFSNPLKSVGGIIGGFLKNRRGVNIQDVMKQASDKQQQVIEQPSLPGRKIPEIPHLELPGFDTSDDED